MRIEELLQGMNQSELVAFAQEANPNAHRGLDYETLVAIISGHPVSVPKRRVDKYRDLIFRFVDKHWKQVEPLLSCPMKTRQPTACYRCTDIQAAECTLLNKSTIERNQ